MIFHDCSLKKGETVKINLKRLLNGEISTQTFEYEFPMSYEGSGYSFPEPARVKGEIKNAGGYIPFSATCEIKVNGVCARCLAPVSDTVSIEISRAVATELTAEDEADEYLVAVDGQIEIGETVEDELILSLPSRLLCHEDCKGLCPKCGCDLNKGKCDCPTHDPDPRWAALKKFLEQK